jgi:hypothetical protein
MLLSKSVHSNRVSMLGVGTSRRFRQGNLREQIGGAPRC